MKTVTWAVAWGKNYDPPQGASVNGKPYPPKKAS